MQTYGPTGFPALFTAGAQQPLAQSLPLTHVVTQLRLPVPSSAQPCPAAQHVASHGVAHTEPSPLPPSFGLPSAAAPASWVGRKVDAPESPSSPIGTPGVSEEPQATATPRTVTPVTRIPSARIPPK